MCDVIFCRFLCRRGLFLLLVLMGVSTSRVYADPLLADTAILTFGGKSVTVYNLSGGVATKDITLTSAAAGGTQLTIGNTQFTPISFEVDGSGATLLPLINSHISQDLTILFGSKKFTFGKVLVNAITFPSCGSGYSASAHINIQFGFLQMASGDATGEVSAVEPPQPLTACQITIDGLASSPPIMLTQSSTITQSTTLDSPGLVKEPTFHPPVMSPITLVLRQGIGGKTSLSEWADSLVLQQLQPILNPQRRTVRMTYLAGSNAVFEVDGMGSVPSGVRIDLGGPVTVMGVNPTITLLSGKSATSGLQPASPASVQPPVPVTKPVDEIVIPTTRTSP